MRLSDLGPPPVWVSIFYCRKFSTRQPGGRTLLWLCTTLEAARGPWQGRDHSPDLCISQGSKSNAWTLVIPCTPTTVSWTLTRGNAGGSPQPTPIETTGRGPFRDRQVGTQRPSFHRPGYEGVGRLTAFSFFFPADSSTSTMTSRGVTCSSRSPTPSLSR